MQLPPRVTDRAFEQLAEIGAADQGQALRVAVEGGGCSGFQYEIKLDAPNDDDLVLEGNGGGQPHQLIDDELVTTLTQMPYILTLERLSLKNCHSA